MTARCDEVQIWPSPTYSSFENDLNHFLVRRTSNDHMLSLFAMFMYVKSFVLIGSACSRWRVMFSFLLFSSSISKGTSDRKYNSCFLLHILPPHYLHTVILIAFSNDEWVISFLSVTLCHFGLEFKEWETLDLINLWRQLIWLSICIKNIALKKDAVSSSLLTPRVTALPVCRSLNSLTARIDYDGRGPNLHFFTSE